MFGVDATEENMTKKKKKRRKKSRGNAARTSGGAFRALFRNRNVYERFLLLSGNLFFEPLQETFYAFMAIACRDSRIAKVNTEINTFEFQISHMRPGIVIHMEAFCREVEELAGAPIPTEVEDALWEAFACLLEASRWPLFWRDLTPPERKEFESMAMQSAARRMELGRFSTLVRDTAMPLPDHPVDPMIRFVVWMARHDSKPPDWYPHELNVPATTAGLTN